MLEEKKFPCVIGCDSQFINNTLTKNGMKEIFKKHLVSTPPGFPVTKETDIISEIESKGMTYPLFVKVSDSYGSVGLDDTSVCHNEEQLLSKCENLFKEFDNLTCEEFIDGQEFSVLILGNCRDPEATVIVYPPAGIF
jgi:D-alanine-D-alanine ligase-like ATP-grasp enzyme